MLTNCLGNLGGGGAIRNRRLGAWEDRCYKWVSRCDLIVVGRRHDETHIAVVAAAQHAVDGCGVGVDLIAEISNTGKVGFVLDGKDFFWEGSDHRFDVGDGSTCHDDDDLNWRRALFSNWRGRNCSGRFV